MQCWRRKCIQIKPWICRLTWSWFITNNSALEVNEVETHQVIWFLILKGCQQKKSFAPNFPTPPTHFIYVKISFWFKLNFILFETAVVLISPLLKQLSKYHLDFEYNLNVQLWINEVDCTERIYVFGVQPNPNQKFTYKTSQELTCTLERSHNSLAV